MATPSRSLLFLFLCLPIVLAMASSHTDKTDPFPCARPEENEIRLHTYLHQFPAWPNVSNPNEYLITNAHGTINYKDVQSTVSSITDVVRELDIHIFYTP
uniref:Uncharacterized protein n=1 Tax=Setaria italica TaxID=4555 RepID=K4AL90_SETIT